MRSSNSNFGADDGERVSSGGQRTLARRWSVPLALLLFTGCAEQGEQGAVPNDGGSGTTNGGSATAGSTGAAGKGSGGKGGSQAGMTGSAGTDGGSSSAGAGGTDDGGSAGMSLSGSAGMGGKAGSGGTGVNAGAGGKGGSGGMSGAGGSVSGGKMCDDLTDCVTKNVCDAGKCRADGCNASNCAYALTRVITSPGSTASKGQVFVSWDNDSLDVKFEVLDATPFDDNADATLNWQDDSVEIYVDLNGAKTTTYQADDFQINVPRLAGNDVVGIGTGLNTAAVMVTRTTNAAGYMLAITIPWTALNNAAYPAGKAIGFDVGVNDDSDGGDRNGQLMLYGSDQNYQNTSQFGTLNIQ